MLSAVLQSETVVLWPGARAHRGTRQTCSLSQALFWFRLFKHLVAAHRLETWAAASHPCLRVGRESTPQSLLGTSTLRWSEHLLVETLMNVLGTHQMFTANVRRFRKDSY